VKKMRKPAVLLLTVMAATLMMVTSPAWATTFTVNSTADTGDTTPDGTCNTCTLREAIQEANFVSGADTINFAIPGAGPHTIHPIPELPDIEDPLTIDGYT
jgi:trimeric autotransporter adhesin